MKQMTKEELIEYFIEQLGDNKILGRFMNVEQIRDKLNTLIGKVTYNSLKGNTCATWTLNKHTLNFDTTKIPFKEEKTDIVHELIHVLSSSEYIQSRSDDDNDYTYYKVGIFNFYSNYAEADFFLYGGRGISEGITDFLAEQITGQKHDGYDEEKSIYKVLSIIIGENVILQNFFTDIKPYEFKALDEASETELVKKYGLQFGTELNYDVVKVLALSDQLNDLNSRDELYGLSEDGRKIQGETRLEIYSTLYSMVERVFAREHNLNEKIARMIALEKMCDDRDNALLGIRQLVSANMLRELFNDDSMDYLSKLEMIKKIKEEGIEILDEAIEEVLFGVQESPELSTDKKLEIYIQLKRGDDLTPSSCDRIYQMYIENGKINEDNFPKKELVRILLQGVCTDTNGKLYIDTAEKMYRKLNEARYYKLGEYYELILDSNTDNTVNFDEKGNPIWRDYLYFNPIDDNAIYNSRDIKLLSKHFSEKKAKKIREQLEEKFEQYRLLAKGECNDGRISIIRDIIRVCYEDWIEETETSHWYVDFYSVDEEGKLSLIPQRREKKSYRRYIRIRYAIARTDIGCIND